MTTSSLKTKVSPMLINIIHFSVLQKSLSKLSHNIQHLLQTLREQKPLLTWVIHDASPHSIVGVGYPQLAVEHSRCLYLSALQHLCRRDVVTLVGPRHPHYDILEALPKPQKVGH